MASRLNFINIISPVFTNQIICGTPTCRAFSIFFLSLSVALSAKEKQNNNLILKIILKLSLVITIVSYLGVYKACLCHADVVWWSSWVTALNAEWNQSSLPFLPPSLSFPEVFFLSEEDIRSVSCEGKQTSEVCRCELQCGCGSKASHSRWFSVILMALLLQQLHGWGWGWVAALLAAHRSSSAGRCHLRLFPACRLTVQRIMKTYDDKHRNKETGTQ